MYCPLCIKKVERKENEEGKIMICENCEMNFHIDCLKKYLVNNNWNEGICNHCQIISNENLTPLIFCKICNDRNGFLENPSNFQFFQNNLKKNIFVHSICLMTYKKSNNKDNFKNQKCNFCDLQIENFSYIKCSKTNCELFFHPNCIEKSKLGKLDFDENLKFNYICQKHFPYYDEMYYEKFIEFNKKPFLEIRNLKNQFDFKKYFLSQNNESINILNKINNNIFRDKYENTNEKLESFFDSIGKELKN